MVRSAVRGRYRRTPKGWRIARSEQFVALSTPVQPWRLIEYGRRSMSIQGPPWWTACVSRPFLQAANAAGAERGWRQPAPRHSPSGSVFHRRPTALSVLMSFYDVSLGDHVRRHSQLRADAGTRSSGKPEVTGVYALLFIPGLTIASLTLALLVKRSSPASAWRAPPR